MQRSFKLPHRSKVIFNHINEFMLKEKLGSGGFSVVYKAFHKTSRKMYAIKVIDFAQLSLLDQVNIEKEIRAHKCMNHKNVVQLYDFFWIDNHVYLVMEYCMGGDLFCYIRDRSPLSRVDVQRIFKQTVDGVAHVHAKGYINRDIKPENILIDRHGNIKICDFGWASHKSETDYRKLNAGTIQYMAPENLIGEYQDFKSDIWSLGVLLYELFNNIEPYPGNTSKEQLHYIYQRKIVYHRRDMPESAINLIEKLLQPEKEARPTIQDIFSSEFLKDYVEVQSKTVEKRSTSPSSVTISIHCYDKPLHGNYERDTMSVSLNSRSTSPDQETARKVSQKQSNRSRTPKKNSVTQLPIKADNSTKPGLVSLRGLINREFLSKPRVADSQVETSEDIRVGSFANIGSNISFEFTKDQEDSCFESMGLHSSPQSPKVKKKTAMVYQSISYVPLDKKKPNLLSTSLNKSLLGLKANGGSRNVSPIKKTTISPVKVVKKEVVKSKSPLTKSPSTLVVSTKNSNKVVAKDNSVSKIMERELSANKINSKKQSDKTVLSKVTIVPQNKKSLNNSLVKVSKASPSPVRHLTKVAPTDLKSRFNPLRQTFAHKIDLSAKNLAQSPKIKNRTMTGVSLKDKSPLIASTKVNPFAKKKTVSNVNCKIRAEAKP